jgi:short-subunit dehydrogenase
MSDAMPDAMSDAVPDASAPRPLALVTGASSGIGLALAVIFAEHGFDLVVTAEDDGVDEVATVLGEHGTAVLPVRADLTEEAGVDALLAAVAESGRALDVLALNAGTGQGGAFVDVPLEDDLRVIALNVTSVVRLAKALVPGMVARGEGRVLDTSSTAALKPGPYYSTYAASKAFGLSFAEALRHELRETGVTVTAVLPGPTDTPFFEKADMTDTRVGRGPKDDPTKVAREAFEALMEGRDKIEVRSFKARVQGAAAAVLPDRAGAAMHGAMTKPDDL